MYKYPHLSPPQPVPPPPATVIRTNDKGGWRTVMSFDDQCALPPLTSITKWCTVKVTVSLKAG